MADAASESPRLPVDSPAVTSQITLLQGIISRLAGNSASCKTWCLTLVGALVSLAGATHVAGIVTFALVPVVIFGFMDTMYLAQEKAYRDLYGDIVARIRNGSYSLADAYAAGAPLLSSHFRLALASWSIYPVYLGLIVMYIVADCAGWLTVLTTAASKP
jgi:hypothetical protein